MIPTPDEAFEILKEYNSGDFHLKHARIVGDCMRWFANELGHGDEADFRGIAGNINVGEGTGIQGMRVGHHLADDDFFRVCEVACSDDSHKGSADQDEDDACDDPGFMVFIHAFFSFPANHVLSLNTMFFVSFSMPRVMPRQGKKHNTASPAHTIAAPRTKKALAARPLISK